MAMKKEIKCTSPCVDYRGVVVYKCVWKTLDKTQVGPYADTCSTNLK